MPVRRLIVNKPQIIYSHIDSIFLPTINIFYKIKFFGHQRYPNPLSKTIHKSTDKA